MDPAIVLAFLLFLAGFAAGMELSKMTTGKQKPNYDRMITCAIFVILIAVLLGVYLFGAPPEPQ